MAVIPSALDNGSTSKSNRSTMSAKATPNRASQVSPHDCQKTSSEEPSETASNDTGMKCRFRWFPAVVTQSTSTTPFTG